MSGELFVICDGCGRDAIPEYCLEVEVAERGRTLCLCGGCARRLPEPTRLAARVVARLKAAGERGLTLRELSVRSGKPYPVLADALGRLIVAGKIEKREPQPTGRRGRPAVRYVIVEEPPF